MEVEKRLSYGLSHHLVNTVSYVCKARGGGTEVVEAGEGRVRRKRKLDIQYINSYPAAWLDLGQGLASRRP